MRTNFFGEPYLQPGDDFGQIWTDHFGETPDDVFARMIETGDDDLWGCEIADNKSEATLYVEGFETREALDAWLTSNEVEITE